ncbi:hypothetical protein I7I51_05340 [Histoplasma capsulatum]|uniref:Uncharacterized protein n=1 Tax=Ajellomyces capsulatus TaxID=5037 RepID=A0A8A1M5E0_AJECA|nr:hypothetical protein I7I51_05340 [Histoplasma capsulatum]
MVPNHRCGSPGHHTGPSLQSSSQDNRLFFITVNPSMKASMALFLIKRPRDQEEEDRRRKHMVKEQRDKNTLSQLFTYHGSSNYRKGALSNEASSRDPFVPWLKDTMFSLLQQTS